MTAATAGRDHASIGVSVTGAALTPVQVAGTNPARAYPAGLAESGRRGMTTALSQAAAVLTHGAGSIDTTPWQRLTPDHVMAVKRQMVDNGAAPHQRRPTGADRGRAAIESAAPSGRAARRRGRDCRTVQRL